MYADHVPPIAHAMRSDVDMFARGCTFVVLTIRESITNLPRTMAEVDTLGLESRKLFGHKRDAYQYIQANKLRLWYQMCTARDTAEAIETMCQVPGLGIVKSAFVAQLMGFDAACIDSRNADREGRSRDEYQLGGVKSGPRFAALVKRYVADTAGRSREYWDAWCEDVAQARKRTAQEISAIHVDCILHLSTHNRSMAYA